MKKFISLIFSFVLLASSFQVVGQDKMSEVWGRIVKVSKKDAMFGYQYFVYLKYKGKDVAYPIEVKSKKEMQLLEKNKNVIARISGEAFVKNVRRGEMKDKILAFRLKKLDPLKLSELSVKENEVQFTKTSSNGKEIVVSPKMTIKDEVANTIIFSAAAVMAGSLIKSFVVD